LTGRYREKLDNISRDTQYYSTYGGRAKSREYSKRCKVFGESRLKIQRKGERIF
jgi:hypothetical protein